MRLSRRRFLEIGAALAAAASIPGCAGTRREISGSIVDDDFAIGHRLRTGDLPTKKAPTLKTRVLIAGGGVAGLSAAWRLRRSGVNEVTLMELSATLGGTAAGGAMEGMAHPWGAHYVPVPQAGQRALVALMEDAGLADGLEPDGRCRVPARHLVRAPQERLFAGGFWQEGLWQEAGAGPDDHKQLAAFQRALGEAAAAAQGKAYCLPLSDCDSSVKELDRISARDWADAHGLTGDRIRWYLEYAMRDDYGCTLDQTSAWALLHYFCSRLIPGTESEPDYMTWPEGNQFLVNRLAEGLTSSPHLRHVVTSVHNRKTDVEVMVWDVKRDLMVPILAEHVILALPQFVVRRVLREDAHADARKRFRYAPWVVCNLHLDRQPESRGFDPSWDNVLYESKSLGYVDAGHQVDRLGPSSVWTWYLPVTDPDERAARQAVLDAPWEHWRNLVLSDLRPAHRDIEDCVTRIDVRRWGHAMVKPVTGFVWGPHRQRAALKQGRVHMAHTDLSGLPLFEEAHHAGTRAAEEILAARGLSFESLL